MKRAPASYSWKKLFAVLPVHISALWAGDFFVVVATSVDINVLINLAAWDNYDLISNETFADCS